MWFFPIMFIVYVLTIVFRPKPKYPVTRTTEQWDAITKGNGPFIYIQGGFIVEIENNKRLEIKWTELEEITAFRREFLAGDEIGLAVKGNNEVFSITENTAGWIMFMNKMKENLALNEPMWFGEIQTSKENIIVYKNKHKSHENPKCLENLFFDFYFMYLLWLWAVSGY